MGTQNGLVTVGGARPKLAPPLGKKGDNQNELLIDRMRCLSEGFTVRKECARKMRLRKQILEISQQSLKSCSSQIGWTDLPFPGSPVQLVAIKA